MQLIGLTGSIASGKSTTLAMFRQFGLPTISADEIVHDLMAPGGKAEEKIKHLFPELIAPGHIDRKELGKIVFADRKKLKQLEQTLHPLVRKEIDRWHNQKRRQGYKIGVVEIPLLFETNLQHRYPTIVVTAASRVCTSSRALKRDGMTQEKLRSIRQRQWPSERKKAHASGVIYTGLGKGVAIRGLKTILAELTAGTHSKAH